MQAPPLFVSRLDLRATAPNVGGLMALCEENYNALMGLAPRLPELSGRLRSRPDHQAELLLAITEQAPYTTTLRLTHVFGDEGHEGPQHEDEPDAVLRAYHDAGQVEVLSLRQTILPVLSHYDTPALAAKWRANLFVSKWLGYCLREGHRFSANADLPQPAKSNRKLLLPSV
ncbi:MAG: DUF1249 domain-containing protein [Gammaproteobacteria bacterium]|jgi:uncharacterized protein YqiB (DUF1249 family)|nr:DUF1249 domain-containing protein [Gammaproteobacteria bacterium]